MRGSRGNGGHRPQKKATHRNGYLRRRDKNQRLGEKRGLQSESKGHLVLVAPIMHRLAFQWTQKVFGSEKLDATVPKCRRQGVLVPKDRLRSYCCQGGCLEPIERKVGRPVSVDEPVEPLIALYELDADGAATGGRTYRLDSELATAMLAQ